MNFQQQQGNVGYTNNLDLQPTPHHQNPIEYPASQHQKHANSTHHLNRGIPKYYTTHEVPQNIGQWNHMCNAGMGCNRLQRFNNSLQYFHEAAGKPNDFGKHLMCQDKAIRIWQLEAQLENAVQNSVTKGKHDEVIIQNQVMAKNNRLLLGQNETLKKQITKAQTQLRDFKESQKLRKKVVVAEKAKWKKKLKKEKARGVALLKKKLEMNRKVKWLETELSDSNLNVKAELNAKLAYRIEVSKLCKKNESLTQIMEHDKKNHEKEVQDLNDQIAIYCAKIHLLHGENSHNLAQVNELNMKCGTLKAEMAKLQQENVNHLAQVERLQEENIFLWAQLFQN